MLPRPFRVVATRRETHDTVTLELESLDGDGLAFAPGQFTMLQAFGVGEVPISISGDRAGRGRLVHTIRDVGGVTRTLCEAREGDVLGVRGPYGVGWGVSDGAGGDVVIVAGGIGLAPLRPRCSRSSRPGAVRTGRRVSTEPGPRTTCSSATSSSPGRPEADVEVAVTVDRAATSWTGRVGLVTELISGRVVRPRADAGAGVRPRGDDALRRGGRSSRAACRPTGSGCPWSGTCAAAWACAATASCASTSSASTARCSPSTRSGRCSASGSCDGRDDRDPGRSWPCGSSPAATAASSPCSTARTSCSTLAGEIEIAYFPEATRAVVEGPYDLSLVEGSVTTADDAARIQQVRQSSRRLVTIGACATAGGIQALRNFADVAEFRAASTRDPSTSRRWPPPPRSPPTSRWTSSCAAARSTGASCSRSSRRSCSGASRGSPRRASAWSASAAATSASRSPTAPRASVRSRTPGAAPSARRTTAAATGASGPRTPRTPVR